jgi:ribonuclease HII
MLELYHTRGVVEAGCDEAGRGCIAGPVVAAAVILPAGFNHPELNDSKKLTPSKRKELRTLIEKKAVSTGIGISDQGEIDHINILNASILAMHRALEKLDPLPDHILVDGNRFKPFRNISYTCIVRGDALYASIAAASILAKVHRDAIMETLHREHPCFGWDRNMGYPTRQHRLALLEHGPTSYHRRSFRLLDEQMRIDFS